MLKCPGNIGPRGGLRLLRCDIAGDDAETPVCIELLGYDEARLLGEEICNKIS